MEQGMEMLFALFGGLAMFLYGMDRMSRALQRAAGDAMKRLLARLTATPLLGVLTGLAVTAVLQSSSAATVMVIGFVSAGLLELPRAVAVIYGINIGTTMTAQLIAFDVQTLVYPVLFLGSSTSRPAGPAGRPWARRCSPSGCSSRASTSWAGLCSRWPGRRSFSTG